LLQVVLTLGGLIGTFLSVFKPSTGEATFFAAFIISSVGMYGILLFPEEITGFVFFLYSLSSLIVSFSFAALTALIVIQAVIGLSTAGYATVMLVYAVLGIFLLLVFNFSGRNNSPASQVRRLLKRKPKAVAPAS